MSIARPVGVAMLVTLFTVALCAPFDWSSPHQIPWPEPRRATTATIRPAAIEIADPHESPIDLHGNEVTDAVATYKLDPAGLLYEEHSPQTELPRLGTPTS